MQPVVFLGAVLDIRRLLTSCLGLGWLPIAPATWASLLPMVIVGVMCQSSAALSTMAFVITAMIILGSSVCVALAPSSIKATGKKDPSEVVVDELAGQAVCYLAILLCLTSRLVAQHAWLVAVAGFLLFRIFDIVKPWPVRQLENLPRGWGILADDLMAGVYAGTCLWLGVLLVE